MSIAASLERTIDQMEAMWQRDNGDFNTMFPYLVEDLRSVIERVSELETAFTVGAALQAQAAGEDHEHDNS